MMIEANLSIASRYQLFREAIHTATLLDSLVVVEIDGVKATRYKHFFNREPVWARHLRIFGEAGTVTIKERNTKLDDRGVPCLFVGYPLNHPSDCYRMYDPETKRVHLSRDIVWLKRMYYLPVVTPEIAIPPLTLIVDGVELDDDDWVIVNPTSTSTVTANSEGIACSTTGTNDATNDLIGAGSLISEDEKPESKDEVDQNVTPIGTAASSLRTSRFGRPLKQRVRFEVGDVAVDYAEALSAVNALFTEYSMVGAAVGGGFDNTSELHVLNYRQAMKSADKQEWINAIDEEHDRMMKAHVWKVVDRATLRQEQLILSTTWAMKKKSSGKFRARVVVRGYMQQEDFHFDPNEVSSPVVHEVTIRILLVLLLVMKLTGGVIDVEGAFLLGRLDPGIEIYIAVPQGFEKYYKPTDVLLLERTMYGTRQAANAFWKQLLLCLEDMNFKRSEADPCLYWKENIFIISWIDDLLIVGPSAGVQATKNEFAKRFDTVDVGDLSEYIGCKITPTANGFKITQPILIQSFVDEFGIVESNHTTPAVPGQVLVNCDINQQVNPALQAKFRTGVGKLLYLQRWSRPDISNAVRELTKFNGKAGPAHVVAMEKVMSYVLHTKNHGLKLHPEIRPGKFIVEGYSDSNYATDPENRRSVTGYSVMINGAVVSFKSVQQKTVSLSSCEAELFAMVSCAQEMVFIKNIFESIGMEVDLPMKLNCDNRGAVFLANNWAVGGRTKHCDVRQFFLRELKDLKILLYLSIYDKMCMATFDTVAVYLYQA